MAEREGMLSFLDVYLSVLDETYMQGSIADMAYIDEDNLMVLKFGDMNPSNFPSENLDNSTQN
jgi:hypothetical protein